MGGRARAGASHAHRTRPRAWPARSPILHRSTARHGSKGQGSGKGSGLVAGRPALGPRRDRLSRTDGKAPGEVEFQAPIVKSQRGPRLKAKVCKPHPGVSGWSGGQDGWARASLDPPMLTSKPAAPGPPRAGEGCERDRVNGRPLVAAGVGQRLAFAAVGIALLAGDLPLGRRAGGPGRRGANSSLPRSPGRGAETATAGALGVPVGGRSLHQSRQRPQRTTERERLHDLGRVLAPGRSAADGDALIADYVAARRLREIRSVPDAGRMIELFALRLRAKELEASVAASAGTDEGRRYSTAVAACAAAGERDLDDRAWRACARSAS